MKDKFSVRLVRASKSFLRSRVGSRTSSLVYVVVATLVCLAMALCGYLRRDGTQVQFTRVTINTGLFYARDDWKPTSLVIEGLQFRPNRGDPARRSMPGPLFDSLDSAEVDSIQVQWGWSFLPTPTTIALKGVRPHIITGKLKDTWHYIDKLPKGTARTFAINLEDCQATLVDCLDENGRPVETPALSLTVGPEVNKAFAFNVVMNQTGQERGMTLRVNYDGHGEFNAHAGNCRLTTGVWNGLRGLLKQNADAHAWWLEITGLSEPLQDWVNAHRVSGEFSCSARMFVEGGEIQSLGADATVTDLHYQPESAPEGSLQSLDLDGTLALHTQYEGDRGRLQVDLGAGNRLDLKFDRPGPRANDAGPMEPLLWEPWLERNQSLTGFTLAGSYRYRSDLVLPTGSTPVWLNLVPAGYADFLVSAFRRTQLEGAELHAVLADGAEARLFAGQPDMLRYRASVTARAPRTGPSAGAWAQADFALDPPANAATAAPVLFNITTYTDQFPVPGQKTMFYTGKFAMKGSFQRVWLNRLLVDRNLDVRCTSLPWLDLLDRKESLRIDDFRAIDGRLIDNGEHPFFVRNGNFHGSVTFRSLDPFIGALKVDEITGAQTGFGEHIVEFGPEKLTGLMEFNLGYITRAGLIDAWQNRAFDLDPDNLLAIHLQSHGKDQPGWQYEYILPWYMTRARPGVMKATHFPARLFPPGVNRPDASVLIDVQSPIDWEMNCWLEPNTVGEGAQAAAGLCALPENNAGVAARLAQTLAFTGLPGKRLMVVKRSLSAPNIAIKSSDQVEAEGLSLPSMGDTKVYPFPRD